MRSIMCLGVLALGMTAACGDSFTQVEPSKEDGGAGPINGGGKEDTGAMDAPINVVDAQPPPPQCDGTKRPDQDACVISEAFGVFVSASKGSDSAGNGSRTQPYATITKAIAAGKQAGRRVYACMESYNESVDFAAGVDVYGYFDCFSSWKVTSNRARIVAPKSPATTANNVSSETRVESLEIVSPDLTGPGASSIGLIANNSGGLHFVNAKIHAGVAGKGADGSTGIQLTESGNKNGTAGAEETDCNLVPIKQNWLCQSRRSTVAGSFMKCVGELGHDPAPSGAGGTGGNYGVACGGTCFSTYFPNADGAPNVSSAQVAKGGVVSGPWLGGDGVVGQSGMNGSVGGAIGTLSANGYVTSDGTKGMAGFPGQSGGGGAGRMPGLENSPAGYGTTADIWGSSGGSGGTGGCPGLPGTAGQGGGASLGVLSVSSPMTFEVSTIESSMGGAGGVGGAASQPTAGGSGGAAPKYWNGVTLFTLSGRGGNGGAGGLGSAPASGGGGPSIAVAYSSGAPKLVGDTLTQGKGGTGGGFDPHALDGLSVDKYAF